MKPHSIFPHKEFYFSLNHLESYTFLIYRKCLGSIKRMRLSNANLFIIMHHAESLGIQFVLLVKISKISLSIFSIHIYILMVE